MSLPQSAVSSLMVSRLAAFRDNYIWLLDDGQSALVVDPGEAAPVLAALSERRLSLAAILVTHHHADHQGGVADLLAVWPQAQVYAPQTENVPGCNRPLRGGEQLELLGAEFAVLAVPGHTLGHLAYYHRGALFCGDTLFGAGCGRLFEGSPAQMAASLQRIAALPEETLIYCAHEYTEANLRFAAAVEPGNPALLARCRQVAGLRADGRASVPSTLAEEKATNPFLRCQQSEVVAAARQQGAVGDDPVAVFAALRAWRNNF
ncbi:hydroxyacylglutathione hydrolase [Dechloromonas sp. ZY10]|uniref:hydroxyacylglutathione hydrolase n=1 Tax=Dechloromonas aquae TaxID=2664436 RepID=UPI003528B28F